jgi:hypothetical protein
MIVRKCMRYNSICIYLLNGILYFEFIVILLTLSLLRASRVASGSSENSVGTGPARVSPSNIWQLTGQDPSFTVGMLSLCK